LEAGQVGPPGENAGVAEHLRVPAEGGVLREGRLAGGGDDGVEVSLVVRDDGPAVRDLGGRVAVQRRGECGPCLRVVGDLHDRDGVRATVLVGDGRNGDAVPEPVLDLAPARRGRGRLLEALVDELLGVRAVLQVLARGQLGEEPHRVDLLPGGGVEIDLDHCARRRGQVLLRLVAGAPVERRPRDRRAAAENHGDARGHHARESPAAQPVLRRNRRARKHLDGQGPEILAGVCLGRFEDRALDLGRLLGTRRPGHDARRADRLGPVTPVRRQNIAHPGLPGVGPGPSGRRNPR
jgi:hypothetical protein